MSKAGLVPESVVSIRPSVVQSALQGLDSFKVLTECPLIVMLLFQLYPKYIQDNIPLLTPLMMGGLALRAPVAAYKLQRDRYREFVACQVKTLSFLTYLLRGFSELMKPYEEAISKAVIALMIACPGDAVATRKELLVATRHILATEFRRGFYRHVDILLDEKVLIGLGRPSRDTLRPLAFSTLADLVHHVRAELNIAQLSRVVLLFSRNLHDPVLPLNVQTTSVRLLLNLVDFIFHNNEADTTRGKRLLAHILQTLVAKFDTLRFLMHKISLTIREEGNNKLDCSNNQDGYGQTAMQIESTQHITPQHIPHFACRSMSPLPPKADSMADVKPLIQTLIRGLKTVMWCISHYRQEKSSWESLNPLNCEDNDSRNHQRMQATHIVIKSHAQTAANTPLYLLSQNEAETISFFFYWGLLCCRVIVSSNEMQKFELKEVLENFAGAFTVLESFNLRSTVGQHVPILFDAMLGSPALLAIAQTLLANSNVSATFADVLVDFLMGKLSNLSSFEFYDPILHISQPKKVPICAATAKDVICSARNVSPCLQASTLLRLFRIILGSVSLFPKNEVILRSRLRSLTLACLQHAAASTRPIAYYFLLRSIFRSISNYISPTILEIRSARSGLGDTASFVLNTLLRLRLRVEETTLIHSIVTELCMTVPMSLTALIPFVPRLLPLLAVSLQMISGDLPSLALRTLEYYLDHLGPTRTCSLLAGQPQLRVTILIGVCSHLKPAPYGLGTIALRILGKLGGRNRHFLDLFGASLPSLSPPRENYRTLFNGVPTIYSSAIEKNNPENKALSRFSSLRILLKWRGPPSSWPSPVKVNKHSEVIQQDMSFVLNIDAYLIDTCELFNSLVRLSLIDQNMNKVIISDKSLLLCRYETLCFRLLASSLCSLFELPAQPQMPCFSGVKHRPVKKGAICNNGQNVGKMANQAAANLQLSRLLYSVVCAASHNELEIGASLLQAISFVFALLLCFSYNWELGKNHIKTEEKAEKQTTKSPREKKNHRNAIFNGKLTLHAFTSTLLEATADGCSVVARTALAALKYHFSCIYSIEMQPQLKSSQLLSKPKSILITDLISRICLSLCEWDLQSRRSVCQTIYQLLTTFGHVWARCNKHILANSLLCALHDHEDDTTLLIQDGIIQALHALLKTSPKTTNEVRLIRLFTREIASDTAAVRLGAQSSLMELNKLAGLPAMSSKLLKPIASSSVCILIKCNLNPRAPIEFAIGALDALNYMLSLHPPAIMPDSTLHNVLLQFIRREQSAPMVYSADDSKVYAQPCDLEWMSRTARFPAALNHSILCYNTSPSFARADILLAAVLRALHGLVRAANLTAVNSIDASSCQNAPTKFKEVLLQCLPLATLHETLDLVLESIRNATAHITFLASSSLLQELLALRESSLVDACRTYVSRLFAQAPLLLNDITLRFLNGLGRMVSLPVMRNIDTNKIVGSFLNHLQEFCYPERIIKVRSWLTDPPLEIATKLLLLISRLIQRRNTIGQVSTISFLHVVKSVVVTVLKLEAAIPKYSSEPLGGITALGNTAHLFSWHTVQPAPLFGETRLESSPFRAPLAQLLSSHATAATRYFLSSANIVDPDHVSLLSFLVSIREAAEFRSRVLSSDGIEMLLNAAFTRPLYFIQSRARKRVKVLNSILAALKPVDSQHLEALHVLTSDLVSYPGTTKSLTNKIPFSQFTLIKQKNKGANPLDLRGILLSSPAGALDSNTLRRGNISVQEMLTIMPGDRMEAWAATEGQFNGLRLLVTLYKLDKHLFNRHRIIGHCILIIWRTHSLRLNRGQEVTTQEQNNNVKATHIQSPHEEILRHHKKTFLMVQSLIGYCRAYPEDVHVLFDLLSVFMTPSPIDFTFLKDFYREEVAFVWGLSNKRNILLLFLRVLSDQSIAMELKVMALRLIVTPMLLATFQVANKTDLHHIKCYNSFKEIHVVDSDMLALFMRSALDTANRQTRRYSEALRVELLKLTTVLIEHLGQELVEHRKDLIKFAWNHLKSEDSLSKQWAYVNVCRFVATYETPPKIILQASCTELLAHSLFFLGICRFATNIPARST
jgi:hypothetical protein